MNEKEIDVLLREAAAEIHAPPPAPREAIWAGIQAARQADELMRRRQVRQLKRWTQWGIGIAALLLVGVGLGRFSARLEAPAPAPVAVRTAPAAAPAGAAYAVLTAQHLSQAEALLTLTRNTTDAGSLDQQTIEWARDLLSTTRLLLDSPAGRDPRLHALLQDLELVLAEITQLPGASGPADGQEELNLVKKSIEHDDVLPRLRTAIPAGAMTAAS